MSRVLVCDDDAGIRELLGITLEDEHHVLFATNGQECLEVLAATRGIGCVILDVMMPEMDGFEALRRIRLNEHTQHVGVIMLTARVGEDDFMHGYGYGADAYLSKPFDPEDLLEMIRTVIGRTPDERVRHRDEERSKAALLRQLERRFG